MINPGSTIGIIGGGQLGRMLALAAADLGYRTHIYCPDPQSPAFCVTDVKTVASYEDLNAVAAFAKTVDVVTFEFENIPFEMVKRLQELVPVRPNWDILHISQNRIREKSFIKKLGVDTAPFLEVSSALSLEKGLNVLGTPCILKTTELGYDGKGQIKINAVEDAEKAWEQLGTSIGILEGYIPFKMEVSVIAARDLNGNTVPFPVVENRHQNGILDTTIAPANINEHLAMQAQEIAAIIADATNLVGLVAVEFFVTNDNKLLVNEIAPRPHNSGHWTLDGCVTSQFEQLVRAVTGLPLGSVNVIKPLTMKNLIGGTLKEWLEYMNKSPDAKVYLYGKTESRPGRKMGHVNLL